MRAMRTRRRHETTIRAGKEEDKEEEKEDDKEEEKEKGYAEEGGGGRVLVAGSWSSGVSVLRDSIMATHLILLLPIILLHFKASGVNGAVVEYYGKPLGPLSSFHHAVSGNVFAVDARTIHIRDFNYDGEGPAAYFYAGNSKAPGSSGFRIADERGQLNPLKKYRKRHVTITLPEGKTLHHIKWLSIWCEEFAVNFGDVKIPKNLDVPKPQKLAGLSGVHSVSSDPIVVVDAQTLLVPSFSYDGEAPDAKFWVGRGNKPSPAGVRVPDENGKEVPLRRYSRKTLVLTLPGDLTVFDIGHFGVWCEAFTVDFGHIQIGRSLNVPPSLKMLGVSPQKRSRSLPQQSTALQQQLDLQETKDTLARPDLYQEKNSQLAIKPTTYRPQLLLLPHHDHRFSQKRTEGYLPLGGLANPPQWPSIGGQPPAANQWPLNGGQPPLEDDSVQIVPSISLTPQAVLPGYQVAQSRLQTDTVQQVATASPSPLGFLQQNVAPADYYKAQILQQPPVGDEQPVSGFIQQQSAGFLQQHQQSAGFLQQQQQLQDSQQLTADFLQQQSSELPQQQQTGSLQHQQQQLPGTGDFSQQDYERQQQQVLSQQSANQNYQIVNALPQNFQGRSFSRFIINGGSQPVDSLVQY
ncbi:uncharacterized protein LOC111044628 isoform X6 [Nilaparvata lugens]|uniref:uncharacterized protein LOC111044628 isoform X6 n=1 Tax=Nilaparvata lugens TaxID=108931 RepID=UPI00193E0D33|nr:uncharacterized protein LOC111044628 isoform X6 [Nilaparvata lugens]